MKHEEGSGGMYRAKQENMADIRGERQAKAVEEHVRAYKSVEVWRAEARRPILDAAVLVCQR